MRHPWGGLGARPERSDHAVGGRSRAKELVKVVFVHRLVSCSRRVLCSPHARRSMSGEGMPQRGDHG